LKDKMSSPHKNASSLSSNNPSLLSKKRSNDFDSDAFDSDSDADEANPKRFKVLTGGVDPAFDGLVDGAHEGHVMNLEQNDPIHEEINEAPINQIQEEQIAPVAPIAIPAQEVESEDEEVAIPAIHADEDEVEESEGEDWYDNAEAGSKLQKEVNIEG
jgi:hypothetical protein